ncbi:MAG TPA: sugar ABC transporter permease [Firmicutes bacterium]|nr:sugar ABC transporter permease [Bacillota bacterium]
MIKHAQARRGKGRTRYLGFIILSLLPIISLFIIFTVLPAAAAVVMSLFDYSLIGPSRPFVGIGNFRALFQDPLFLKSLWNTIRFVCMTVPLNILVSLPVALGLNRIRFLRSFFRACYYIPTVTSLAAVSLVWLYLYDPATGLINALLRTIGLPTQSWLGNASLALPSIVLVYVWQDLGYNVVIFLAALQGLPATYYEAAQIDGAGSWQLFRYITLPLLKPTMGMVVILTMISAFKVFTPVHIMTQGGPMNSTKLLVYYIYENAFSFLKMGYASAMAVMLFGMILLLTLVQLVFLRTD